MKKYSVFILMFLLATAQIKAQVNMNPDPTGEPWWGGEISMPDPLKTILIFELQLTPASISTPLPNHVSNNALPYFPPTFCQIGSSCAQAAEIGYVFTYEMNRLRNVSAGIWSDTLNQYNLYYHLYSFNFLNEGGNISGTEITSGFNIVKENGCPMYSDYYDPIIHNNDNNEQKWDWI